jgi:tRNA(Ile)-lysidine synthase
MHLIESVLRTIRRHRMVPASGRVAVAVSGGPDSVGLLHVLLEAAPSGRFTVGAVAHFNHQLRGEESDADETFCRELARSLGLGFEAGRADVRAAAARERRSIEDAARMLRYGFLRDVARRTGVDAIAVGHTRDDQAETFLLRLIRGSGTRGLGGIRPTAGPIVRPLLEVPRGDLLAWVETRGLAFRLDATNADLGIPRNRVRHELLPYLERAFSPNIVEVLAREAEIARADEDRLELEAIELATSVVLSNTDDNDGIPAPDARIVIAISPLSTAHPALAHRVLHRVLEAAAKGRFVGFEAVQQLHTFVLDANPGARLSLPGCEATREGEHIRLGPATARSAAAPPNTFRIPLSIPGEVEVPGLALRLSASWAAEGVGALRDEAGQAGYVRGVRGPLSVRSRVPGDRFQPPGLGGRTKKLQDYFVDRKVARQTRDSVPLVVDADDRIIWVVGHGFSEAFRAAGPSSGVILLKARRLGGEV